MSQQRRERQQQEEAKRTSGSNWGRRAFYAVVILLLIGAAYLFNQRHQHRLDSFARCLNDRGIKMYGAYWCPHCVEQKEKFGASLEFVPYIECGIAGNTRGESQVCKDADIKHFPTWQFPPTGERVERIFELEELRDRSGCTLP
jgi:hypothetical protein